MGSPILYAGFVLFVLAMLALDLGVFHRKAHVIGMREAALWSGVWVCLASLFAIGIWAFGGDEAALEFGTGYVIEKALAVDNIFVFVLVFAAFRVPEAQQHRVLAWGILGALAMRAVFIFAGAAVVERFDWTLYVFGAILAASGVKLFFQRDAEEADPADSRIVRLVRRLVPVSTGASGDSGGKFFVREHGRRMATPLFLGLVTVEASDLIFAVDSVPAIFAVTTDPFLVFTSNIFAILGLRSMYFLLAGLVRRFRYLKHALSAVLVFVGAKMLLAWAVEIPTAASLLVIVAILATAALASYIADRNATSKFSLTSRR